MTILDRTTITTQAVLDAVNELAPTIAGRAEEIERACRIPPDLVDELSAAGCFRLLLPPSHGGAGADLSSAFRAYETLARADASVGWTVMIGSGAWSDLVGLSRAAFDEIFTSAKDVIVAGAINPTGSIVAVDGGYRATGRWGFVSGCQHADWILGNCIEEQAGGEPNFRIAVFEPEQVVIEDTWTVSGLSGTGSHHVRADDVVVPRERTLAVMVDPPCLDVPIVHIGPPMLLSLGVASVAIGIAQGALDDIVALAVDKVPLFAQEPLAATPLFQFELATADTELRAARALLHETAEAVWHNATGTATFTLEERARVRAAAVWVTEHAATVVTSAYRWGGGGSVYVDSPLQRRLRDVNAATQHFLLKRDTLTTAGGILAGQGLHIPVF